MAMKLRYMGEFLSREGVTWRVELRQDSPYEFDEIGALTFEATQALTIEWSEKKKEEVVCGSVATIQIEPSIRFCPASPLKITSYLLPPGLSFCIAATNRKPRR